MTYAMGIISIEYMYLRPEIAQPKIFEVIQHGNKIIIIKEFQ